MPEWVNQAVTFDPALNAKALGMRLGVALLFGVAIATIYRLSHGRLVRDCHTLVGTLVLLTILLAMVTMVIGESVARAFGLVGALSIVRFRTIVEDTRDTAFVIFAVVVGMAVGTGVYTVALVGVPIVGVAAVALSLGRPGASQHQRGTSELAHILTVRIPADRSHEDFDQLLNRSVREWKLAGVSTARQGAALDVSYFIDLGEVNGATALVAELNQVPGVQSVDIRASGPREQV